MGGLPNNPVVELFDGEQHSCFEFEVSEQISQGKYASDHPCNPFNHIDHGVEMACYSGDIHFVCDHINDDYSKN